MLFITDAELTCVETYGKLATHMWKNVEKDNMCVNQQVKKETKSDEQFLEII